MNTQKKPTFFRNEIFFSMIEFFNADEVTLIGHIEENHHLEHAQYITNKKNLYRLLKNSGKLGAEIIQIIIDAFQRPHGVPVQIDLNEIFGKPICLESCSLKLDRSFYQDDAGDWKIDFKTNLFFIDEVRPLKMAA